MIDRDPRFSWPATAGPASGPASGVTSDPASGLPVAAVRRVTDPWILASAWIAPAAPIAPSHLAVPQAPPVLAIRGSRVLDPARRRVPAVPARSVDGLSATLVGLSGLMVVLALASAASSWFAVSAFEAASAAGLAPAKIWTVHDSVAVLRLVVGATTWLVGSLWLARVRSNARRVAPRQPLLATAWCWFGWVLPVVCWWFPKRILDASWRTTADALPVLSSGRRTSSTTLWWSLWLAWTLGSAYGSLAGGIRVVQADPHRGVMPWLEVAVALVAVMAFGAWRTVVRGVSWTQEQLARQSPNWWR